ncbi:hypothetical protein ABD05_07300 [Burkholderia pyrrocinia]|nr:hypothetical protein ABD05_07300 [Burkholderia pyrrocinia]
MQAGRATGCALGAGAPKALIRALQSAHTIGQDTFRPIIRSAHTMAARDAVTSIGPSTLAATAIRPAIWSIKQPAYSSL